MGKQCRDVLDIVPETVVLAFNVAGWSETDSPRLIKESKALREAIKKAVDKEVEELARKHFPGDAIPSKTPMTPKQMGELAQKSTQPFVDNRTKELSERLKCHFNNSPLGVWIDENSWILWIAVPVLISGAGVGGYYLYRAETGDQPAKYAAKLATSFKPEVKTRLLGTLSFGAAELNFKPSERKVYIEMFGKAEWRRVSLKVNLGYGRHDVTYQGAKASAEVKAKLAKNVDLTLGTAGYRNATNMAQTERWGGQSSLKLKFQGSGAASNLSLTLEGVLDYGAEAPNTAIFQPPVPQDQAGRGGVEGQMNIWFGVAF